MNRFAIQRAHAGDLVDYFYIEIAVHAEAVIQHLRAVQDFPQMAIKVLRPKRLLRTESASRTLNTGAAAVPNVTRRITRPDKQRVLMLCTWYDDGDRFRLLETGQVNEIRVLVKAIMRVVRTRGFACRGNNCD